MASLVKKHSVKTEKVLNMAKTLKILGLIFINH